MRPSLIHAYDRSGVVEEAFSPAWAGRAAFAFINAHRPYLIDNSIRDYLAPGSVATIEVPLDLVGKGYEIRVGAP